MRIQGSQADLGDPSGREECEAQSVGDPLSGAHQEVGTQQPGEGVEGGRAHGRGSRGIPGSAEASQAVSEYEAVVVSNRACGWKQDEDAEEDEETQGMDDPGQIEGEMKDKQHNEAEGGQAPDQLATVPTELEFPRS